MKKFTEREQNIIYLIGKGFTNKEIAEAMGISKNTVGMYIYNLCRIAGAKNRIELFNTLKKEVQNEK